MLRQSAYFKSVWLGILLLTLMLMPVLTLFGQEQSPFATNTPPLSAPEVTESSTPPSSSVPIFATATSPGSTNPVETDLSAVPTLVLPLENYALRFWFEKDLLALFLNHLDQLKADPSNYDLRQALRLIRHEFQTRIPDVPSTVEIRDELLTALLESPRGSLDMRFVVRPFIQEVIQSSESDQFEVSGFQVEIMSAELDGKDPEDAIIHVFYPADAIGASDILYEEYLMALGNADKNLILLEQQPDLYALPFGGMQLSLLENIADLTGDGLNEVVLSIDDGNINRRLMIYSFRNGIMTDMVFPADELRYTRLLDNPAGIGHIPVMQSRSESDVWDNCLSSIQVNWVYRNNYFRPESPLNAKHVQDSSLACALLNLEPIFAQNPGEAIQKINEALSFYPDGFVTDIQRANLILAMLYTLNGQIDGATNLAQLVHNQAAPDSWAQDQSQTLLEALSIPDNTALDVCEALIIRNEEPACDMDDVLGQLFMQVDLPVNQDIITRLQEIGLPVIDSVEIAEVGRVDRMAVQFGLAGSSWWAFSPRGEGQYIAESIPNPLGEETVTLPVTIITVPEAAYKALLMDQDPIGTINILQSERDRYPNAKASSSVKYLEALSHDLIGDRTMARQLYYQLWQEDPDSIWGDLAAQHLEQR
ncbi:hypothetical protein MASR2M15_17150 [Anaerolineales bacterium]